MKFVKKAIIAFVLAFVLAVVTGSGTTAGSGWIAFYITAWIMQGLCIENDKPLYKKVFIHAIWIAIVKAILVSGYELAVQKQVAEISVLILGIVLYTGIYYVTATITGFLTLAWIAGSEKKKEQESIRSADNFCPHCDLYRKKGNLTCPECGILLDYEEIP